VVAISESECAPNSFGPRLTVTNEGATGGYNGACYPSLQATSSGEIVVGWLRESGIGTEATRMAILTPTGGPSTYEVTVNAFCNNESQAVQVQASCSGQTKTTPCTFSGLSGSNAVIIASVDALGHSFRNWNTGGSTLTVSSGGTYTAYYGVEQEIPTIEIDYRILFGVGTVAFIVVLVLSRFGLVRKLNSKPRRRHR
jgi:hypothetical protein